MKYRSIDYFNENDLYLFKGINYFLSKIVIEKDKVYTVKCSNRCQYKATTIECININELN